MNHLVSQYIKDYDAYPNLSVLIYGSIDSMITKHCPITKIKGVNKLHCNLCKKHEYVITDPLNNKNYLVNDGLCNIKLISDKKINMIDQLEKFKYARISYVRTDFFRETAEEMQQLIQRIKQKLD